MPYRPLSRDQTWLLPPSLDDLVPADHPARFVAAFVDTLTRAEYSGLGLSPDGELRGAPAYHPRARLSVWLYGFLSGGRSARKLEAACRDQLPYLWLTGWQRPDHNTLWRFYQAHRTRLRPLLKRSVQLALKLGLLDLAVQAVDGTKVAGNAARERTYDAAGLERLLARTAAALADLEAQNATGGDAPPPRLPAALTQRQALRAQVLAARAQLAAAAAGARVNLTDGDAALLKTRQGYVAGYNAQAMVTPVAAGAGPGGLLITAAEVTTAAHDTQQLVPLLDAAAATTERAADQVLADGGYHSGANLTACQARGQVILMPEAQQARLADPYHKEAFAYDATTDTYTCPQGQTLGFQGTTQRSDEPLVRVYRAATAVCHACPVYRQCTKGPRGRAIEQRPDDEALRRHRQWMATDAARTAYRQRKCLPEPAFGILKEQQGARRFLLRGLAAVQAEWSLLATAFNLRTLYRVWRAQGTPRGAGAGALG